MGLTALAFCQGTVTWSLQGRVTGVLRVISCGLESLGALTGGVRGGSIGARPRDLIAEAAPPLFVSTEARLRETE